MFIDTHIDTLWAMRRQDRKFYEQSEKGHVDLRRGQEADLLAGFFTGFPTESQYLTERMLAEWLRLVNEPRNMLRRIYTTDDIQALIEGRKDKPVDQREIGIVLHFEGAAGIDTSLNRLHIYYDCGLRSMGLTWNEENQFATGQQQGESRGLTTEGKDLLAAMENLGIIVDVSHLNDKSFWDVISCTNGPVLASHSNVRELAGHRRNLTSDMVKAIADTGGSIGVNLCTAFLNDEAEKATRRDAIEMFGKIISLTGPEHVHSGTDLDGATIPADIGDITGVPKLLEEVVTEYSLDRKEKEQIQYGNVLRIADLWWK